MAATISKGVDMINQFISNNQQSITNSLTTSRGIALLSLVPLFLTYQYLSRPFYYAKKLEEVGYIEDGLHSKEKLSEYTRKRRLGGDLPPPFPNGWYFVINSKDLKKGEVKSATVIGQLLAVFRGEEQFLCL